MFCNQCGKEVREGAVFCPNCGAKQTQAQQAEKVDKTMGVFNINDEPSVRNDPFVGSDSSAQDRTGYSQNNYSSQSANYNQNYNQGYVNGYAPNYNPAYSEAAMQAGAPNIGVSFGEAIKLFFKNYVNFNGRASRSEYWWVVLFNALLYILEMVIIGIAPIFSILVSVIALGLIIPGLALTVRRLHDIGKAWYWMFMSFIPLAGFIIMIVYMCTDSVGDNMWGYGPYRQFNNMNR